jgi:O-antigen ligase
LVAFGGVVLLSSAFSEYPGQSFSHLDTYFPWLLIYFSIVRSVYTPRQYFLFLVLYLACNLKMTQHGFFSWAAKGFAFDSWGVVGGPGWFHNSGEFGIQLCIFAPLAGFFLLAIWRETGVIGRTVLVAMPASAVVCALASSSRGAIVGLFIAAVWAARRFKHVLPAIALVSALAVVTVTLAPDEFKERFESMGSDKTSTHRLDRWTKGWETMMRFPILGVGHEAWVDYYREHLRYGQPGSPLVHNIIVQCATELGFVGLTVLCILIFRMLQTTERLRKIADSQGDNYAACIAQGLEMSAVGLLASSMFVTVLYYPFLWIHAAFISAFAQSYRSSISNKARR